jgi:hypothetical protein
MVRPLSQRAGIDVMPTGPKRPEVPARQRDAPSGVDAFSVFLLSACGEKVARSEGPSRMRGF